MQQMQQRVEISKGDEKTSKPINFVPTEIKQADKLEVFLTLGTALERICVERRKNSRLIKSS